MKSFFKELKRRNVFKVAVAYTVISWVLVQIVVSIEGPLNLPDWFDTSIIVLLIIGLPLACIFTWAFELTPEGVKATKDVAIDESITSITGRKLDFIIIGVLTFAIVVLLVTRNSETSETAVTTANMEVDKSIAVLPFLNMSSDKEQQWFADGLTEEILNSLARTPDLRVSSRTASFQYKETEKEIATIAKELAVAHILEGSVRRGKDRVRITVQLIRASDGFHLWSETYDRTLDDIIKVQEEIAIKIAQAMHTVMDPDALAAMVESGTASVEAYENYLKANSLTTAAAQSANKDLLLEALKLNQQATDIDPTFAQAYLGQANFWRSQLSDLSVFSGLVEHSKEEVTDKLYKNLSLAKKHAKNRILQLELIILEADFDVRLADKITAYEEIVKLTPTDGSSWHSLGVFYIHTGKFEKAKAALEKAIALAPENFISGLGLTAQHMVKIDPTRAIELIAHRNIESEKTGSLYQQHRVYLWAGETEKAAEIAQRFLTRKVPPVFQALVQMRQACADQNSTKALAYYEEFKELKSKRKAVDWIMLNILGYKQKAEQLLKSAEEYQSLLGISSFLAYLYFDVSQFPKLEQHLKNQGIIRPLPVVIPFSCNLDQVEAEQELSQTSS